MEAKPKTRLWPYSSVQVKLADFDRLKELAKLDRRGLAETVGWLIEKELKRRETKHT